MQRFKQFISESSRRMVFSFGRFNPPTIGHQKLIERVAAEASGRSFRIYASQSQDKKKNPLSYEDKIRFMRKMFPRYGRHIIYDTNIRNVFDILVSLYNEGYSKVTMVVGSDRVTEFETLTNKYNGVDARHGFYNFEGGVQIVSAGERDPDKDDVSGMSASKVRAAAAAGEYDEFLQGIPPNFPEPQELYNQIRRGLGLSEERQVQRDVKFRPISEEREAYIRGELQLEQGQVVEDKRTGDLVKVSYSGTNYVVLENDEGQSIRRWIHDVKPTEESTE